MSHFSQPRPTRAPRVSLRGNLTVVLELENRRRFTAKVHQLSITGGLLELRICVDEQAKIGLTIPVGSDIVRPKAEMLFPMWGVQGYMQPFRFTELWAEERQVLEKFIGELLQQSVVRATASQGPGHLPRRSHQ
jgi:hypothetical protein